MQGAFAHGAKIRRRADQAPAKMMKPGAVHEDSRSQWICAAGEPMGKGEPAPGRAEIRIFFGKVDTLTRRGKDGEHAGRDCLLRLFGIATMKTIGDGQLVDWFGEDG